MSENTPNNIDQPEDPELNETNENAEEVVFNYTNVNVSLTVSPFKPDALAKQKNAKALSSFGLSLENLDRIQTPNPKLLRNTDERWQNSYGQTYVDQISNIFLDTAPNINLERSMATGAWVQHIDHNGVKLQTDAPRIEPSTNGQKLTGTAAISKMNMLLGGGKYIRVPLFGSGFWITLSVPSNSALLNLNLSIEEKKGQVGRATVGAIFSNRQALLISDIYDFILEHIYDTSIKNWTEIDLKKYIKSIDLYPLLQAMSVTMFPEGFKYEVPCVHRPTDCNYIQEVTLNLGKMFWTDESKLNQHQRKFMYDSLTKTRLVSEIETYQTDMALTSDNKIVINENISAILRISSVDDLISSGDRWINDVINIVDKLAFSKATEEQRQYILHSHMMIASIREYSHYVERFVLNENTDDTKYIEEHTTIEAGITSIAGDTEHSEVFTKGIAQFIERNIVTVIGTPNFQCPECNSSQTNPDSLHPLICAFDPLVVFITLLGRRLSLIGN